jgi:hypothetical protein
MIRDGSNPQRACSEALTQVAVVSYHKAAINYGRSLTMRLLSELDAVTSHLGELEREIVAGTEPASRRSAMLKAVSLPIRAAVMVDLATACRILVGLERQAFGIVEEKEPPPPAPPEPRTLEELRVTLLAQMAEFGLSPFDLTEPIGVGNRPKKGTTN